MEESSTDSSSECSSASSSETLGELIGFHTAHRSSGPDEHQLAAKRILYNNRVLVAANIINKVMTSVQRFSACRHTADRQLIDPTKQTVLDLGNCSLVEQDFERLPLTTARLVVTAATGGD
eukprot:7063-Heterococcus_DN1.PRE.1